MYDTKHIKKNLIQIFAGNLKFGLRAAFKVPSRKRLRSNDNSTNDDVPPNLMHRLQKMADYGDVNINKENASSSKETSVRLKDNPSISTKPTSSYDKIVLDLKNLIVKKLIQAISDI